MTAKTKDLALMVLAILAVIVLSFMVAQEVGGAEPAHWMDQAKADQAERHATDYTCVNSCVAKGYGYSYCTSACSFNDNPVGARIDYTCVNDCTAKGYQYGYCKSRCSY